MKQSQKKQLQRNQPKQDQQSLLLVGGIDHEIEAQFVRQPKTCRQLGRVQQEQQPYSHRPGIFKDINFHERRSPSAAGFSALRMPPSATRQTVCKMIRMS